MVSRRNAISAKLASVSAQRRCHDDGFLPRTHSHHSTVLVQGVQHIWVTRMYSPRQSLVRTHLDVCRPWRDQRRLVCQVVSRSSPISEDKRDCDRKFAVKIEICMYFLKLFGRGLVINRDLICIYLPISSIRWVNDLLGC